MSKMKLVYVTERRRIKADLYVYLEKLLSDHPDALLIREKDLSKSELLSFCEPILSIAAKYNVPLILRGTPEIARKAGIRRIQLSYREAIENPLPTNFDAIGVSVHSLEEAQTIQSLGADYITYGHIFMSPCKPGLPPRGLELLDELIANVTIPVYAIGGITPDTIPFLLPSKVTGACLMSAAMTTDHPETFTTRLRHITDQA